MVYENGKVVRAKVEILKGHSACSKRSFKLSYKWLTNYEYLCQLFGKVNQRHTDYFAYRLFNLTPQSSPSWEAKSTSTSQIPHILCYQKVHYHAHDSPPLVPKLHQFSPSLPKQFLQDPTVCLNYLLIWVRSGIIMCPSPFPVRSWTHWQILMQLG
jgi:hypothetical protein